MIKNKQRELISLLVHAKNTFKTSIELAKELSLSDRTVRTYLNDLKEIIQDNGALIISKQGYGYQLQINDRKEFNLFLIKHHFIDKNQPQSKYRESSERKHYLLNLLLLESQRINIDDLSEYLCISSSQLNKDIAEIKSQLLPYELSLKKSKSLIFVDGQESAKRHFIMSYFFHQNSINFLQRLTYSHHFIETISFDMLTIIILDECREAQIKLSDVMIQNIVLHLSLSIKRLQSGLAIQHLNMPKSTIESLEFDVAKKILVRVEAIIGFDFPKEEQMYLTLHLMAKSNLLNHESDSNLNLAISHLLIKIQQETGYRLYQDEQLKHGLIQHLKPMLIRLEQNIKLDNPLLCEIKENHAELFTLTKHYCKQLPFLIDYDINDDEWGYLALHFLASIEKLKNDQKIKVLIICATGMGSAQLLKNRIEREFEDKLNIVATVGYYETNNDILNEADFIISSIDLSSKIIKIPVFHVSVFFSEQDVQKIRRFISLRQAPVSVRKDETSVLTHSQKCLPHIEHTVDDLLANYFYCYEQKQPNREPVLAHLLDLLAIDESLDYKKNMMQQMDNRMMLGEILFSSTIVVPHPAVPVGQLSKIGIAIIPDGLFWSNDYPNVHFVFMISPSVYQNPDLAMMTKAIVALIDDLDLQEKMLKTKTYMQFKQLFITLIEKEYDHE